MSPLSVQRVYGILLLGGGHRPILARKAPSSEREPEREREIDKADRLLLYNV